MSFPIDLDAFVGNRDLPYHFVRSARVLHADAYTMLFRCSTTRYRRTLIERYGTAVEVAISDGEDREPIIGHIELCAPHIVRLRMYAGMSDVIPPNQTPMLVTSSLPRTFFVEQREENGEMIWRTDALTMRIQVESISLHIESPDGAPICASRAPPPFDAPDPVDVWLRRYRGVYPAGYVTDGRQTQVFYSLRLRHDEQIYGMGEKFGALNKRGQRLMIWNTNAMGVTRALSYKNIPFFMSSAGYGVFTNTGAPLVAHFGDQSHIDVSVHVQDRLLDSYFIIGDSFKAILAGYADLTGKPALPPLWSFGLWASDTRYRQQADIEHLADRLRAENIPADVIHIDSDTAPMQLGGDVALPPERFPDVRGMIAHLRARGLRASIMQLPYLMPTSAMYSVGVESEYFARRQDGTPNILDGLFGKGALVDFSNPSAAAWFVQKIDTLLDAGFSAIALSGGDSTPIDAHYWNASGATMRNLYTLYFARAIYERLRTRTGDGLLWSRAVFAGSQRYPVVWSGYAVARWDDLAASLRGGLSMMMSGFAFWGTDIGGFDGEIAPALYIRWAQAALFASHVRWFSRAPREPWALGDEVLRIFRQYAQLRYQLMPYIWSMASRCAETGLPLMRPLILEYPDDPTCAHIDDQWLFGDWLLIAPILDESSRRKVYLPRGLWVDYWTRERHAGGAWIAVEAALDVLPIYIRAGAIIPMAFAFPIQSTDDMRWSPLALDIVPGADGAFTLVEGDARCDYRLTTIENGVEIALGDPRPTTIFLSNMPEWAVVVADGERLIFPDVRGTDTDIIINLDGERLVRVTCEDRG